MSVSFRLKYLLGFIPSAQKLDAAWDKLVAMRDNLSRIEASPELSRYNELKSLIESADFQHKKRDITGADFKQSSEFRLLQELKNLEKQKRIKQYFQLLSSADLAKFNKLADSDKMGQYRDLKTLVESPEFAKRKKEIESIDYKHSPEFKLQQEYQSLKNDERLKHYYKTIASSEYLHFMELEPLVKKGKVADDEARMKVYHQFLKSKDYDNLKAVENANLPDRFEELKLKVASNEFTEREAYLNYLHRQQIPSLDRFGLRYQEDCIGPEREYLLGLAKEIRREGGPGQNSSVLPTGAGRLLEKLTLSSELQRILGGLRKYGDKGYTPVAAPLTRAVTDRLRNAAVYKTSRDED